MVSGNHFEIGLVQSLAFCGLALAKFWKVRTPPSAMASSFLAAAPARSGDGVANGLLSSTLETRVNFVIKLNNFY